MIGIGRAGVSRLLLAALRVTLTNVGPARAR